MQEDFSSDGNALSDLLDHYTTGLREITRSAGIYGAEDPSSSSTCYPPVS